MIVSGKKHNGYKSLRRSCAIKPGHLGTESRPRHRRRHLLLLLLLLVEKAPPVGRTGSSRVATTAAAHCLADCACTSCRWLRENLRSAPVLPAVSSGLFCCCLLEHN
jgi:hypothetical protein